MYLLITLKLTSTYFISCEQLPSTLFKIDIKDANIFGEYLQKH